MMVYDKHNIEVSRTARYWLGGDRTGNASTIIIVLHGYAFSALSCLQQFETLGTPGNLVVSPEGLSRFYRKGFDGEVVASWMTREDRLQEIADQKFYLDKLLEEVGKTHAPLAKKVIVIGFSQGAATGARWIASRSGAGIGTFVVYAGEFAPDVIAAGWPRPVKVVQVYSETDEFIPSAYFHDQASTLEAAGIPVYRILYQGSHAVVPEAVEVIQRELINVNAGEISK